MSGFGYLIYAAYLAEVEHKILHLLTLLTVTSTVSTEEILMRSANRLKLADEHRLGSGPLCATAKSSAQ